MSRSTLRQALRGTPPQDFPLKVAWRQLIRAARLRKRETGERGRLLGQGDVQRALDQPVLAEGAEGDLAALKQALRRLARGEPTSAETVGLAADVDRLVAALVALPAAGPVRAWVRGWPDAISAADRGRLLAPWPGLVEGEALAPADAALLAHRLDGLSLAGGTLRVEVALAPGERLPAVPRAERFDAAAWSRDGPWLPHLDDEGRFSLTPKAIARQQAAWFAGLARVVDGCCGCGGNAIALAEAGLDVVAIERDADRLRLARDNAAARGVLDRIRFVNGRVEDHAPEILDGETGLLLDPPWGGPGAEVGALVAWLTDRAALLAHESVLLKLPCAFPVERLPPRSWQVRVAWGREGSPDAHTPRLLTVTAGRTA